jgi:hypothetical protein
MQINPLDPMAVNMYHILHSRIQAINPNPNLHEVRGEGYLPTRDPERTALFEVQNEGAEQGFLKDWVPEMAVGHTSVRRVSDAVIIDTCYEKRIGPAVDRPAHWQWAKAS